jgi:competence protein ComEC
VSRGPVAAVAFAIGGNLAAQCLADLPSPGACVALLLCVPLLWRLRTPRAFSCAVIAFAWTVVVAHNALSDRWPAARSGADVQLAGWIEDFPVVGPDRVVFTLHVTTPRDGVPRRVRLSWYRAALQLAPGDGLELTARLRSPHGLANPGAFDHELWLLTQRIGATGYVRSGRVVPGPAHSPAQRWLRLRAGLARDIASAGATSRAGAALLTALTLGERDSFADRQWTDLRRTGTTHLVAISGLHVGLVAALVYTLVAACVVRLPALAPYTLAVASVASLIAATTYAGLAGFSVPTQRALLMLGVAGAVLALRRRVASAHGLAVAAVIVLALDPLATLSVSFWLSFAAVAALLLIGARTPLTSGLANQRRSPWRWLAATLRLQWGLAIALAPLTVISFGELSLVSPLVNLVAVPLFALLLVPLSLAALATACVGGAAWGLVDAVVQLGELFWRALHAISAWPGAAIRVAHGNAWTTPFAVAAALLLLPAHPLPGRRLLYLAIVPLCIGAASRPASGAVDMLVFDVGHGLAVLVETAQHTLLYDAGPVFRSGFDTGGQIVAPGLMHRGIKTLDVVVVSHADADHAGGAPAIIAAFPEAKVLHGPDVGRIGGARCMAGQRWAWDGVAFEFLYPDARVAAIGNDSSCVLKITSRYGAVLLTGDIERLGERALVAGGAARADVVVVPHHGSATSSSTEFVAAVRPRFAIVSAAHDGRWAFPRPEVTRRWERAGARMLLTADSGAIEIALSRAGLQIRTERDARKRYWSAESGPRVGESSTGAL